MMGKTTSFVALVAIGCGSNTTATPSDAGLAASASSTQAGSVGSGAAPMGSEMRAGGADEIKPVYPVDGAPPNADAQRLCEALHALPEKRIVECCGSSISRSSLLVGECARVLTAAINHGWIALASSDVNACERGMADGTAGCDWITASSTEPVAPACVGILKGLLAAHAKCRSSLECGEGFECSGLSTVDVGSCEPPKPAHAQCNLANDMLATMARQDGRVASRAHPECAGYCAHSRCEDAVVLGAACKSDSQCGPARCIDGKCGDAALPVEVQPCSGGACTFGTKCVKGICSKPKLEGAHCDDDGECRGTCVRLGDDKSGKCEKVCPVVAIPTLPGAHPKSIPLAPRPPPHSPIDR